MDFPEWIEVFETGIWTSKEGLTREWTDTDLEEIASSYDPNKFLAPLTIGHPEDNSPAYGWVKALKKEGNKLLMNAMDVDEEFNEAVKKGLYRKISMAVFPDMTLKHIGFLGGKAPALKGLKPVFFGEKKAGWTFEMDAPLPFGESTSPALAGGATDNPKKGGIKMTFKDFLEKMKGLFSEAEKGLSPEGQVTPTEARFSEAEVQAREAKAKKDVEVVAFAETVKLRKEKEESDKKLKDIETKARKDGIASFCEGLCKEGKLTPALRKIIEPVMVVIAEAQADPGSERFQTVQFSEGVKKPALDGIKDFLAELPKVVTFREVTPAGGPAAGGSAAEKLSAMTKQKMEAKKDLSYSMAFSEVQKENPELAKEYLSEIIPKK